MKKIYLLLAVMLFGGSSLKAQENNTAYDIDEAWFVSAGAGANLTVLNFADKSSVYGGVTTALDLAVGKWFTPSIGARFGYSGLAYDNSEGADEVVNIGFFHGDLMVDPVAYFRGYDIDRFYSPQPYVALGVVQCYSNKRTDFSAGLGVFNAFRISDKFDANIDLRASVYKNYYLGSQDRYASDIVLSATVGATYKFGRRSAAKIAAESAAVTRREHEIKSLQKQVSSANDEALKANDTAKQAQDAQAQTIKDAAAREEAARAEFAKKLEEPNPADAVILFDINSSKISSSSKLTIGFWAKSMKENPDRTYTITGYADDATGSPATNKKISKARVDAVAKVLVKDYDIDKSQLIIESKGGKAPMIDGVNESSRAVRLK